MSPVQQKPILHGRDHCPGGPDEIPGLGGGAAHEIQDEGTPLTDRAALDFVGAGVTATDDAGNDKTIVTIAGGGGGGPGMPGHRIGTTEDRWYMSSMFTIQSFATNLSAIGRFCWPFVPTRDMTLDRIGIQVTVAIAGSTARLGIYTDNGNIYPDALLVDTGAFATSAPTGTKLQTISQPLDAGELYWLTIHFSHASVACRSLQASSCIPMLGFGQPSGTTSPAQAFGWMDLGTAIAALPNPYPGTATVHELGSAVTPCIMVRGT